MKIKSVIIISLLLALVSLDLFSQESGQYVSGQSGSDNFFEDNYKGVKPSTTFIGGEKAKDAITKTKGSNDYSLPQNDNSTQKEFSKKSVKEFNQNINGSMEKGDQYSSHSDSEIVVTNSRKGKSSFSLSYFQDSFDYSDQTGIFKKTYEDSTYSMNAGYLLLSSDRFLYRGWIDLVMGLNFGIGYNEGRGFFETDQVQSNTTFTLWCLPTDFSFGFEIPIASWLKLGASGGPSAMGLIQVRDDKDNRDSDKRKHQISYGYFADAKFQFSLSRIFTRSGFKLFSGSSVSQLYLNLEARMHNYSNFQDENIEISGQSFGLGFTFEYF